MTSCEKRQGILILVGEDMTLSPPALRCKTEVVAVKFLDDIYYKNARLLSVDVVRRLDRKPQLMMGVQFLAGLLRCRVWPKFERNE